MSEDLETREGQMSIMIHGAEKFGLDLDTPELDCRNYRLHFMPCRTERRFSDFDGVITFQGLFERKRYMDSWTDHSYDRDELDKREKEAHILIKNGGFIVFLLHVPFTDYIYERGRSREFRDTDLVKRFLNWDGLSREDFDKRYPSLRCVRDEFLRFFELYGAVCSLFRYYGDFPWRPLAFTPTGGQTVSMVIADRLFFVPCLLPEQGSKRREEFFRLLTDAVVTCGKMGSTLHYSLKPEVLMKNVPREVARGSDQAECSRVLVMLRKMGAKGGR